MINQTYVYQQPKALTYLVEKFILKYQDAIISQGYTPKTSARVMYKLEEGGLFLATVEYFNINMNRATSLLENRTDVSSNSLYTYLLAIRLSIDGFFETKEIIESNGASIQNYSTRKTDNQNQEKTSLIEILFGKKGPTLTRTKDNIKIEGDWE